MLHLTNSGMAHGTRVLRINIRGGITNQCLSETRHSKITITNGQINSKLEQ